MTYIEISNLCKSYSTKEETVSVFENFNLGIAKKTTAFFGPNGCGKTTLLKLVAGLTEPDKGKIKINTPSGEFNFGYVFQSPSGFLFPWMSNFENIVLPLKLREVNESEISKKVNQLMQAFGLDFSLDAYPYQLSGGQKQIVVILRALIDNPSFLILDEPFASLDYLTKIRMQIRLVELLKELDTTTLFVSHTVEEAIFLADEIVLLSHKPCKILDIIKVKLRKRPKSLLYSKKFLDIKENILSYYNDQ